MVKSCFAVGCPNCYHKGCGLSFYRFPANHSRRNKRLAAIKRKDWQPSDYSWICSAHFVSGKKSNDPLSPDYVPSVFMYVPSPHKQKIKRKLERYKERVRTKKRCLENSRMKAAAEALIEMSSVESLRQENTSTSTSTDSDTGTSTQTDP